MLHCEAYSVGSLTTHQSWRRETPGAQGEAIVDIQGDVRVMVLSNKGILLVTEARLGHDSGTYSCVATNIYGTSKASSHVTVLSKLKDVYILPLFFYIIFIVSSIKCVHYICTAVMHLRPC